MPNPAQEKEQLKKVFEKKSEHLALSASMTADKLKLFVDCTRIPKEGESHEFTRDELSALLSEKVRLTDIQTEILDDIIRCLNEGKDVERRRVSKGTPAKDGTDGKLLLLVKQYQKPKEKQQIDFVDPRFIRHFDNIEKGTIVGRVYPETTGTDGIDALGQPIKAKPGKPFKPSLDKSVVLQPPQPGEKFQNLVADETGYLGDESGKLIIKHELALNGDIDYRIGDIDFIGSVKVKGSVMKDFRIIARDQIEINGDVESGFLQSITGEIIIKGRITGTANNPLAVSESGSAQALKAKVSALSAQVKCAQTLRAQMLDNTTVEANGDIILEKEARNSRIHTRATLIMPQGHLLGGEVYTVCGVDAKFIGTDSLTTTTIILCSDIESTVEYSQLNEQMHANESAQQLIELHLGPYAENPKRLIQLNREHRVKMEQLLEKLKHLKSAHERLQKQRDELLSKAHHNTVFRVNFQSKLYQGTVIKAGTAEFKPEQDHVGPGTVEYIPKDNRFEVGSLKSLECHVDAGNKKK